jgi:hypothetical protein
MDAKQQPAPDHLVDSVVGYHNHTGKHEVTPADWEVFITFARKNLPKS